MEKRERALDAWAVAHWLGYQVPDHRPRTKEERALARRGLNAFGMAVSRGNVPPPDFMLGKSRRWFETTVRAWLGLQQSTSKRGRKPKMGAPHA